MSSEATAPGFGDQLSFALKALSMGRGRLASEMAVDKSLVTRWLNGTTRPSAHNLERLSRIIAGHCPAFTMLDWELPLADLAARLGVDAATPARAAGETYYGTEEWLMLEVTQKAISAASAVGEAADGFWRATAPMPGMPGYFGQSFSMLSSTPGEAIRIETGCFSMRRIGWGMLAGGQFCSCMIGIHDGYFAFSIFNRVNRPQLDMMDGIILGCLADNGGTPLAVPCVMERVGGLSADAAVNERQLTELLERQPILTAAEVAEPIRHRLSFDPAAQSLAGTGNQILMMSALQSLACGSELAVERPPEVRLRVVA